MDGHMQLPSAKTASTDWCDVILQFMSFWRSPRIRSSSARNLLATVDCPSARPLFLLGAEALEPPLPATSGHPQKCFQESVAQSVALPQHFDLLPESTGLPSLTTRSREPVVWSIEAIFFTFHLHGQRRSLGVGTNACWSATTSSQ